MIRQYIIEKHIGVNKIISLLIMASFQKNLKIHHKSWEYQKLLLMNVNIFKIFKLFFKFLKEFTRVTGFESILSRDCG